MPAHPRAARVPAGVLRRLRDLRDALWLWPVALALGGGALGVALPAAERRLGSGAGAHAFSPGAAQDLLGIGATVVASLLAIGFSIAMVTVQLAASQYTPRLLRRFMGDRSTQAILAFFTGTLTFLVVLVQAVGRGATGGGEPVPRASFLAGVGLTAGCVALMPLLLHHVTRSIQVSTIVAGIARDTTETLESLELAGPALESDDAAAPVVLRSPHAGYLQVVDADALLAALPAGCTKARVEVAAGEFVLQQAALLSVWPDVPLDRARMRRLEQAFAFSRQRNLPQDALYGVRQLVDMALKALSPGMNDVTTAVMAVNELAALAVALLRADAPATARWRVARAARPTLLVPALSLEAFVRAAFDEVVLAAREQPRVLACVLDALHHAARLDRAAGARAVLFRASLRVLEVARESDVPSVLLEVVERRRGFPALDGPERAEAPPGPPLQ